VYCADFIVINDLVHGHIWLQRLTSSISEETMEFARNIVTTICIDHFIMRNFAYFLWDNLLKFKNRNFIEF
jgi:hypothetical protein